MDILQVVIFIYHDLTLLLTVIQDSRTRDWVCRSLLPPHWSNRGEEMYHLMLDVAIEQNVPWHLMRCSRLEIDPKEELYFAEETRTDCVGKNQQAVHQHLQADQRNPRLGKDLLLLQPSYFLLDHLKHKVNWFHCGEKEEKDTDMSLL